MFKQYVLIYFYLFAWDFPNCQNLARKPFNSFHIKVLWVSSVSHNSFELLCLNFFLLLEKPYFSKRLSVNLMATQMHNQLLLKLASFTSPLPLHNQTVAVSANSNSEKHPNSGSPQFSLVWFPVASWAMAGVSTIKTLLFTFYVTENWAPVPTSCWKCLHWLPSVYKEKHKTWHRILSQLNHDPSFQYNLQKPLLPMVYHILQTKHDITHCLNMWYTFMFITLVAQ